MQAHAKIWAFSAAIGVAGCAQGAVDGRAHGRAPQDTGGVAGAYGGTPLPSHSAGSGGKSGTAGATSSYGGSAGRGTGGAGGAGSVASAGAGGASASLGLTGSGGSVATGTAGGGASASPDCPSLTRVRLRTGACADRIAEFSVASTPTSIVTGSDGQVWVDDDGSNQLLQLDSEGRVLKQVECNAGSSPRALLGGSDDALVWYTDAGAKTLVKVTQTAQTPLTVDFTASAIARGEGDELWLSEAGKAIYQVRPYVATTPFPVAPIDSLVLGPDQNVWFPTGDGLMAQLIPGQDTRYFSLGPSFADDLCVGPDGALWFADGRRHQIGRMDLSGNTEAFDLPLGSGPSRIIEGPDGALWFTEESGDKIGRMTVKGDLTQYPIPTTGGLPHALTVGGDDNIWFTEKASGKVGRLILDP
jgi:virginiamycin B lyase